MKFKELELFKGVDFSVIKEISEICTEKHYDKDEVLFHVGEKANRLFFLDYGAVNLVVNSTTGVTYGVSEPGEIFGWSAMVGAGVYTATGVAITDLNVFEAEKEKLNLIFNRHPKDGLKVMKSLAGVISKRLNSAYQDLITCREK